MTPSNRKAAPQTQANLILRQVPRNSYCPER